MRKKNKSVHLKKISAVVSILFFSSPSPAMLNWVPVFRFFFLFFFSVLFLSVYESTRVYTTKLAHIHNVIRLTRIQNVKNTWSGGVVRAFALRWDEKHFIYLRYPPLTASQAHYYITSVSSSSWSGGNSTIHFDIEHFLTQLLLSQRIMLSESCVCMCFEC